MKKCWWIPVLALLLCSCGAEPVMETVADVYEQPVLAPQQILLDLPEDAQTPVSQTQNGDVLYMCDDLAVSVYTLPAGDLEQTWQTVTGYSQEELFVIGSYAPEGECYECAWTTAGETQLQVGTARLISDGSYHYVVAVMAPEAAAGGASTQIRRILDSFCLEPVNTDP